MCTVHPLLLGFPSLLDKSVHHCWVGFCPYVIAFVSINCWLLSFCVLLENICLLSIRYYLGIPHYWIQSLHYCWVAICPFVIGFVSINCFLLSVCVLLDGLCILYIHYYKVSFITGYSLPCMLGRYLSVYYWVCVYQLMVTVCPYVDGRFMSTVHLLLLRYPSKYSLSIIVGYLSVYYWACF